jgi:peptidoglycan hydrolase-like protein with peptidoglycan-binding domain
MTSDTTTPDRTEESSDTPHAPSTRRGLRRAVRWRVIVAVVLVVALGAAAVVALNGSSVEGSTSDNLSAAAALPTGAVERRDLVVSEDIDGELGFGEPITIAASRTGVVTSLPEPGTVVKAGEPLYAVDLEPTVLLPGKVPAYRALNTDSSNGPDVKQLEQALVDLGFDDDLTVDREFGSATADVVEDWEDELNRDDPDGEVELGDVVFAGKSVRIGELLVDTGAQVQAGTPVLTYSPGTKVVSVDLDANRTDLLPLDASVDITLLDGSETTGTVTSVGTEAETDPDDPQAEPTVPVEITIDDPGAVEAFDTGEVTVTAERSRREDVLTVPVTALLALAEGGYAVQVPDSGSDSGYRLISVDVGTYSDGFAEVSGDGVEEGLEVVVPE